MRTKQVHQSRIERSESVAVLRKIQIFLKDSGMPETRFGRMAVNDPRLVRDLRNGREPGPRMVRRIESFLAERSISQ
ncbi:hypothetical protein P1X14_06935 [Sphingomonas sp. AOB5]|uniref:hypothetical protein n=1 Tax=Sphingomonas sp. AOB5 TaxID=3034017 RepID=UPI0023F70C1F|nr:hypothetical protein [Sphingomonas sp. AOB5]MDF7774973.1 hypothetical protein [Sphingomonas sp. AOB5]